MTGSAAKAYRIGIIGGIIGGVVFGLFMQMQGMLGMVASLAGSESLFVGWVVHMVISVIFGLSFAVLTFVIPNLWTLSLLFGIGIWIIGPLLIMPAMMGMGTNLANAFTPDLLMSLVTHIGFSFIVGATFKVMTRKKVAGAKAA
ncbi:DUF1440 domain-containing protein [Halobacillus yeomjeoni]|uniref:DUF1440 domain-containing protein n=1 Tax=Halobacillus yeomjeoni TaxID=311194 RepID=UPI001CD2E739|nr:DUF1440 domain-containing protein [Halobacillus yeomjeoni]MCA0984983.1 DUF1440 domain-containing protein [Halobacillus yeomjeoni]